MKKIHRFLCLLLTAGMLSGCGSVPAGPAPLETTPAVTTAPTVPTVPAPTEPPVTPAMACLAGMTLRQKVGQLFLIRPDALDPSLALADMDSAKAPGVKALSPEMEQQLQRYPVGGFILFSKNIESPDQLTRFTSQLWQAGEIPPFLTVDEEGGLVARIARNPAFDVPKFSSARQVFLEEGVDGAARMGRTSGTYLRGCGINMDMAPVADVHTNPDNTVIGTRAFSNDPTEAALGAGAMADGLSESGIIPVFKHFPGHGDTVEDSHENIAVSRKTRQELLDCEWIPFRQATFMECIMVGHIAVPEVTGDMTPATLSPILLKEILREELGFGGLIMTDSLAMGAIIQNYTPGEAALAAFGAGCDLLLMPYDLPAAFDAMVEAVESGEVSEDQLDETVLRILQFKYDHGLLPG